MTDNTRRGRWKRVSDDDSRSVPDNDSRSVSGMAQLEEMMQDGKTLKTRYEAACRGRLEDLEMELSRVSSHNEFLKQLRGPPSYPLSGNVLHLATVNGRTKFVRKAIELLDKQVVHQMLSQLDAAVRPYLNLRTPLHIAVENDDHVILNRLLQNYRTSTSTSTASWNWKEGNPVREAPWLVPDSPGLSAWALTLVDRKEKCALEFLSVDEEQLLGLESPSSTLVTAVRYGMNQLALRILESPYHYTPVNDDDGKTALQYVPNSTENVCLKLLEKHQNLITKTDNIEYSVLHEWAEIGESWPLNLVFGNQTNPGSLNSFKELIKLVDKKKRNPLHIAVIEKKGNFAQQLLRHYHDSNDKLLAEAALEMMDDDNNTPLHLAMTSEMEETALLFMEHAPDRVFRSRNKKGESPLLLAVKNGCGKAVKEILSKTHLLLPINTLRRNDGLTVIHALPHCLEEAGKVLVEKYWWLHGLPDDHKKTALDYAKENNAAWLIDMLEDLSSVKTQSFDWIKASEEGDTLRLSAYIHSCHDLLKVCLQEQDTPLHHLKQSSYEEYQKFLRIPMLKDIKNTRDKAGDTPLHRVLRDGDGNIHFAKALLNDDEVERNIKDKNHESPMDLLLELYNNKKPWKEMCLSIGLNPRLTNLGSSAVEMRSTLSVVAALLATLTFAAGFALPGGINSDTGQAVLGKKAAFLVFIIADTYAMCCSMIVLFCLIWSMVYEREKSQKLIDRSVRILIQSLLGTLLAFMTGVYAVIHHKSLWASIIVFVMCSLVAVFATSKTVLYETLHKFDRLVDNLNPLFCSWNCKKKQESGQTSNNRDCQCHCHCYC